MFLRAHATDKRLKLYRDVLAVYKKLITEGLIAYGIDEQSVEIKNTIKKNVNRAPLIVIERGDYRYEPKSLMFNEKTSTDVNKNLFESSTVHILEYPLEFTCYGNSYLEAEKLGGLVMEAVLTTGMSIIKSMHPNIIGADFVDWSKSSLVEGGGSSLIACTVDSKVFLKVDGYYSIKT